MTFWEKLKSWKRWGTILGAAGPLLLQAMTGEISWALAIFLSISVVLAGLGVIGWEDVTRLKAGAAKTLAESKNPPKP